MAKENNGTRYTKEKSRHSGVHEFLCFVLFFKVEKKPEVTKLMNLQRKHLLLVIKALL